MIRFQSRATADLLMFTEHGVKVFEIWGKAISARGILLRADMPAALEALQQFAHDSAGNATARAEDDADDDSADAKDKVSWQSRLTPLMTTMQRCIDEDADLTWELR